MWLDSDLIFLNDDWVRRDPPPDLALTRPLTRGAGGMARLPWHALDRGRYREI